MSDNLADAMFAPEPQEHDQNHITAMEIRGQWFDVVPGTLEMGLTDLKGGDVQFFVDRVGGGIIEGVLTEVTGLRSNPVEDTDSDDSI